MRTERSRHEERTSFYERAAELPTENPKATEAPSSSAATDLGRIRNRRNNWNGLNDRKDGN